MNERARTHNGSLVGPLFMNVTSALSGLRAHMSPPEIDWHGTRFADKANPTASVISHSQRVSAFDLEQYALRTWAGFTTSGKTLLSPEAGMSVRKILAKFIEDDGPTPQVGPTPDRSFEVQWLANGCMLSVLVERTGEVNLYARDMDGDVALDEDISSADEIPDEIQQKATAWLRNMAQHVTVRPDGVWASDRPMVRTT